MGDKLGFRRAAKLANLRVGDYVTRRRLREVVPEEGLFFIKHTKIQYENLGDRFERHVYMNRRVTLFSEEVDPYGLATSAHRLMYGDVNPTRLVILQLVNGDKLRIRYARTGDGREASERPVEFHVSGLQTFDTADVAKEVRNFVELIKVIPGLETEAPDGLWSRFVHMGCARVTKISKPVPAIPLQP